MKKNTESSAFPQSRLDRSGIALVTENFGGLTKREIFAMHALQGILANADGKAIDSIVREAVMFADMTLERLCETNK